MLDAIDQAVEKEDSDRSKFIRNAVRARIVACGIAIKEAA